MSTQGRANGYLPAAAFNRKERIVVNDDGYYFRARGQALVGPFDSEADVNFEVNIFIQVKAIEQELENWSFLQQVA